MVLPFTGRSLRQPGAAASQYLPTDLTLKEAFTQKYRLPVTVVNDANCVALGEKWIGSAKNAKDDGSILLETPAVLAGTGFALHMDGEMSQFAAEACPSKQDLIVHDL